MFLVGSWDLSYYNCLNCLLSFVHMGSSHGFAECEDQPWPQCTRFCVSAITVKWNLSQQSLVLGEISLLLCSFETNWILLWYYLKLSTGCVGFGVSREELVQKSIRHCLWLVLGNLSITTKQSTICGCFFWTGVSGKYQAVHQG